MGETKTAEEEAVERRIMDLLENTDLAGMFLTSIQLS
jgi:hypothetical protein